MKQKITIYDLAKASGLSPATVSRVLNHPEQVRESTRKKVENLIRSTSFHKRVYAENPNQPIHEKPLIKSPLRNTYMAVLPTATNPFYGEIIEGLQSAALDNGCHILVDYFRLTDANILSYVENQAFIGIGGIITFGSITPSSAEIMAKELPFIQCSEYNKTTPDISSVSIDDEKAEYTATSYALSRGYRHPVFFSSPVTSHYARRRWNGFRRALEESGIRPEENMRIQIPRFDFSLAHDIASRMLSREEHPDVMICISDIFASACLKAALEQHIRVPEELGILGFDDIAAAQTTTPGITTIRQHRFQLGYTTFEILHAEKNADLRKPQHIQLETELVVRGSTR